MTLGESLVRWSARIAMLLAAAGAGASLLQTAQSRLPLRLWTLGCIVLWIHVGFAFHFVHHWSHATAELHTAGRTAELTGFRTGAGIWANYLLLAGWTAESVWLWRRPGAASPAVHWLRRVWQAYFVFIAFNAVVVFEAGPVRWIGAAVFASLAILAIRSAGRRR